MTVPQRVIASVYHELTDRLAIMGNFGWDNWSQFGKVDVSLVSQTTVSAATAINYQDTYHVAVGGQYRLNPAWLLNGGLPTIPRWSKTRIEQRACRSAPRISSGWV